MKQFKHTQGFTLMELTIVLAIITYLIVAGSGALKAQVEAARNSTTKTKLETAKQAITTFVSRNKRLPCPAVTDLCLLFGYAAQRTEVRLITSIFE